MRLILIVVAILFSCMTKAQSNDIETNYKEINDTLIISFINTGNDTLQLFSTYFEKPYIFSKVLHKVDTKNKVYKISFLPALPISMDCARGSREYHVL